MAESNLEIKASSVYTNLVTFTWGVANVARYAASNRKWIDTGAGVTFAACPSMIVDMKKQTGGTKDDPISITMPPLSPASKLILNYAHANVTVLVEEIDTTDVTTRKILFKGMVGKVTGNKNGRADQVELHVVGVREKLNASLGVVCTNTCAWGFGDKSCGIVLATVRVNTNITVISGNNITISNTVNPVGWYFRGYVTVDGLNIGVRDHKLLAVLELIDPPPPEWLNAAAVLTPGCDKQLATCGSKWANTGQFGGFGVKIPKYHPVYEKN